MERQKQNIASIGLLYLLIISVFRFITLLMPYIIIKREKAFMSFIEMNGLWIITTIGLIILLTSYYNREKSHSGFINLIKDNTIRKTSGVFIILQGITEISTKLPMNINSIQTYLSNAAMVINANVRNQIITANTIELVIILCQILLGFYLLKIYTSIEN